MADELIARFRTDFERLVTPGDGQDYAIALAVSGGPDSMAMLGLAARAFPRRVIAATVDHRLRPESANEAALVATACARLGVPHAILPIETPPPASGNLHAWARQERYRLLKAWAGRGEARFLCTAHHADDQAETFLMRAARACGLSGLAAIRARTALAGGSFDHSFRGDKPTESINLLRPLLGWRRQELRAAAQALDLPWVDDPSNRDSRFDRTRFRGWLAAAPWIDPLQIARTAENMASVEQDLAEISGWLWAARALDSAPSEARLDVEGLPRGVKRYLVRLGVDHVLAALDAERGSGRSTSSVEALLDALEAGRTATLGAVLASAKGTIWHFRAAPPRRSS